MNPNDVALVIGKRFFFSNCDFYGKPGRVDNNCWTNMGSLEFKETIKIWEVVIKNGGRETWMFCSDLWLGSASAAV